MSGGSAPSLAGVLKGLCRSVRCALRAVTTRAHRGPRARYVRVHGFDEPPRSEAMKRRSIFNCCTGDTGVADADDPADDEDDRVSEQSGAKRLHAPEAQRLTETEGESRVSRVQKTAAGGQGNSFMRLAPDNPWLVCRSADHGGRLFWMHERTHETTWRQPLPRLGMLPLWGTIEPTMYERCFAVTDPTFFGAYAANHCSPVTTDSPKMAHERPNPPLHPHPAAHPVYDACAVRPTLAIQRRARAFAASLLIR